MKTKSTFIIILSFFVTIIFSLKTRAQTTVTLQAGSSNVMDAWVWSLQDSGIDATPFSNYNTLDPGFNDVLRIEMWDWGFGPDTIRGFISFDLSGIPSNATIISADLSLYYYVNPGYTQQVGNNAMFIQRVTSTWNESTISWKNQPTATMGNQVSVPSSTSSTQNYLNLNVKNLVQDMINAPLNSFGFRLLMQNETVYKGLTFASSDHSNTILRPKLVINYSISTYVKKTDNNFSFSIFPNPGSQNIKIKNEENQQEIKAYIINFDGTCLKEIAVVNNEINISDLQKGIYTLILKTSDHSYTQKFAKD